MKPINQPIKVQSQPQLMQQQAQPISDDQAIQIMNKLKTQGSGAIITVDDVIGQMGSLFAMVVNQKNKEIAALKEEMAKREIQRLIDQKAK